MYLLFSTEIFQITGKINFDALGTAGSCFFVRQILYPNDSLFNSQILSTGNAMGMGRKPLAPDGVTGAGCQVIVRSFQGLPFFFSFFSCLSAFALFFSGSSCEWHHNEQRGGQLTSVEALIDALIAASHRYEAGVCSRCGQQVDDLTLITLILNLHQLFFPR